MSVLSATMDNFPPLRFPGNESLAFVLNISRLVDSDSFVIAENHQLRRATAEEIPAIRGTLERFITLPGLFPWEQCVRNGHIERMPENEWHYYVISFTGNNRTIVELEDVFNLARLELSLGFTFLNVRDGHFGLGWNSSQLFQKLHPLKELAFLEVSAADVDEIRTMHSQILQHDDGVFELRPLVRQLRDLGAVPQHSPLLFLGYFAVLESLLTHRPNPTDLYQSITRQVKKKIALLDNRFEKKLDYGAFGEAPPRETVWTKMYEYRSALAHGDEAQFDSSLQLLGNKENALKLVKDSVKSVIRQALKEPRLVADLREC